MTWGSSSSTPDYDGYDPDWHAKYMEEQRAARFRHRVKGGLVGYACGQAVGSCAYVLQTGRASPAALGAGAFLGVCIGVGHFMRSG